MRIGILGTIWLNTPPPFYGGTEEVVYNLANGLVEKGHQVTLFAPATTKTKAHLSPTVSLPLRSKDIPWTDISYHLYHITQAFDRINEFDILHVHLNKNQDYMALPLAAAAQKPVVTTLHFALPLAQRLNDRHTILQKYKDLPYTSISASQRKGMDLNFIETIYNSLQLDHFPFSDKPQDYVAWIGKIVPHKGTKEAILAAKKAGVKIKLAGVVDEGVEESKKYFEEEIKPLLGDNAEYIGPVDVQARAQFLGGASALLVPILWEEPFGLVMAEAQAVGTPVIAFNRGAASEVIQNNKTGFLVNTIEEMAEKMKEVATLNRQDCRIFVEKHFSIPTMVQGYENSYQTTITNWPIYQLKIKKTISGYKDKMAEI